MAFYNDLVETLPWNKHCKRNIFEVIAKTIWVKFTKLTRRFPNGDYNNTIGRWKIQILFSRE